MPSERQTGTVAKWLNHKGIGFITPNGCEEGQNDILVHFGELKQETSDGFKSLEQGSTVEYDLQADPKNAEKQIAVNVTGANGEDCVAKTRRAPRAPREDGEEGATEKKSKGKKGKGKGKKGKGKKGKGKGKKPSADADEE